MAQGEEMARLEWALVYNSLAEKKKIVQKGKDMVDARAMEGFV